jgi:Fe-S cluster biogenesis protein NfuA
VLDRVETLLQSVEACPDPAMRETARELVRELLDFHRAGLARMLELAGVEAGRMAADPAVAPLLFLHGVHPEALERRVERALEKVRPYLASHGGSVELVGTEEGRVRLRLLGSCDGCPSSRETLRGAIQEAVLAAAPDAAGIEVA